MQQALPLAWQLDPRIYQSVLYVVETKDGIHWGLTSAANSYVKASKTQSDSELYPSKAVCKLQEALYHANVDVKGLKLAVDLGESPVQPNQALKSYAVRYKHWFTCNLMHWDMRPSLQVSRQLHILHQKGVFDVLRMKMLRQRWWNYLSNTSSKGFWTFCQHILKASFCRRCPWKLDVLLGWQCGESDCCRQSRFVLWGSEIKRSAFTTTCWGSCSWYHQVNSVLNINFSTLCLSSAYCI